MSAVADAGSNAQARESPARDAIAADAARGVGAIY